MDGLTREQAEEFQLGPHGRTPGAWVFQCLDGQPHIWWPLAVVTAELGAMCLTCLAEMKYVPVSLRRRPAVDLS